jgi:Na+/alanine symporter
MLTEPSRAFVYVLATLAVVFVVVAIAALAAMRFGPLYRFRDALRGALEKAPDAHGAWSPLLAVTLAATVSTGAAAVVGLATAIGVGGTGAIAWTVLFALLAAPLRGAEVFLARTSAVSAPQGAHTGSLAGRERGHVLVRRLLVASAAVAVLGFASVTANALLGLSMPAASVTPSVSIPLAVAAAGLGLALIPAPWSLRLLGATSAIAWTVVFAIAIACATHDPSLAAGALPRAISDAFRGAPDVGAFTGALASEATYAALRYTLLPLVLPVGTSSALEGHARSGLTARLSLTAGLAPLASALTLSIIGIACVATGAFHTPREAAVSFSSVTIRSTAFETAVGRGDASTMFSGSVRIRNGQVVYMHEPPVFASDRALIDEPRFEYWGAPADLLLQVERGRVVSAMRYQGGALDNMALDGLGGLVVVGRTAPRESAILRAAIETGAGPAAWTAFVAALGALSAAGVGALGLGLGKVVGDAAGKASAPIVFAARALPSCLVVAAILIRGQPFSEAAIALGCAGAIVSLGVIGLRLREIRT